MTKIRASITAVQGYLPEDKLTNADFERMVETSDEWIVTRTGIKERRILKQDGLGASYMGAKAAQALIEKTGIDPASIDMVLCTTITPDMFFPSTANLISHEIGAVNAFGYDLMAACSGFIYGFATAAQFIETGRYKRILMVSAEKMSTITDYQDRTTCILFGDAAAAVLIEPDTEGFGLQDFILQSDGSGKEFLHMKGGGSLRPASIESVTNREHFVFQEGQSVFKVATSRMSETSLAVMERNNLVADDVAWLVPHQANLRILDLTARRIGIPRERVMLNIEHYGNTTSATIPLCLWDYQPQLRKGDNLILTAFGGGFTWGAMYLKWAYDTEK